MRKPFYTVDKYTHRAYLQDGRVVEIDKTVHAGWPVLQIKPAVMSGMPASDETVVGSAEFGAAYHAFLTQLQQAGTELGVTTAHCVVTTVKPVFPYAQHQGGTLGPGFPRQVQFTEL